MAPRLAHLSNSPGVLVLLLFIWGPGTAGLECNALEEFELVQRLNRQADQTVRDTHRVKMRLSS